MKANETDEEPADRGWTDPDDAPPLAADWFAGAELRDGDRIVRRGNRSRKAKGL